MFPSVFRWVWHAAAILQHLYDYLPSRADSIVLSNEKGMSPPSVPYRKQLELALPFVWLRQLQGNVEGSAAAELWPLVKVPFGGQTVFSVPYKLNHCLQVWESLLTHLNFKIKFKVKFNIKFKVKFNIKFKFKIKLPFYIWNRCRDAILFTTGIKIYFYLAFKVVKRCTWICGEAFRSKP